MRKFLCLFFTAMVLPGVFAQVISSEFYLEPVGDDFLGVYLPVEYLDSLARTKNHSVSMHLNDDNKYHDMLAVRKNIIYSNMKFHDGYAIKAAEGKLYRFNKNGQDVTVTDNNGWVYQKISDDPEHYEKAIDVFVATALFKDLSARNAGVSVSADGKITLPFLYSFTSADTYYINLDDLFFEEGASALLTGQTGRGTWSDLFLLIQGDDYSFYDTARQGPYSNKADHICTYSLNEDKRIIAAMTGLDETQGQEYRRYLDGLPEADKRVIVNALFALNGYSFASEEWRAFFSRFSWYKPDKTVRNNPGILNPRQKNLLDYLNK